LENAPALEKWTKLSVVRTTPSSEKVKNQRSQSSKCSTFVGDPPLSTIFFLSPDVFIGCTLDEKSAGKAF
jgi:hypothetical protein